MKTFNLNVKDYYQKFIEENIYKLHKKKKCLGKDIGIEIEFTFDKFIE